MNGKETEILNVMFTYRPILTGMAGTKEQSMMDQKSK